MQNGIGLPNGDPLPYEYCAYPQSKNSNQLAEPFHFGCLVEVRCREVLTVILYLKNPLYRRRFSMCWSTLSYLVSVSTDIRLSRTCFRQFKARSMRSLVKELGELTYLILMLVIPHFLGCFKETHLSGDGCCLQDTRYCHRATHAQTRRVLSGILENLCSPQFEIGTRH
jgi:hypothetical protein